MFTSLHRRGGILLLCGAVVWLPAHATEAADLSCTGGNVRCLIDAINASNGNSEANTIHLDASTYSLTTADNEMLFGERNGLPIITGQVTITGVARDATFIERANYRTLGTANPFRIFRVAASGRLTLDRLTLRGGEAGGNGAILGAAIRSSGVLMIGNCAIVENHGNREASAILSDGGYLGMTDTVVARNHGESGPAGPVIIEPVGVSPLRVFASIERSVISDNFIEVGAGIDIRGPARVGIIDTAIVRNHAFPGWTCCPPSFSDGIWVGGDSWVELTNVTIAAHHGDLAAGVRAFGGTHLDIRRSTIADNSYNVFSDSNDVDVRLENSILAGDKFGACHGAISSAGHNVLEDSQGCGTLSPDDLVVPTGGARLGSLVDTGTTAYVPLLADSPAIDLAADAACTPTDQRGLHRPIDGNGDGTRVCDAGAIEFYPVVNDLLQLDGVTGAYVPPNGSPNPLAPGGEFHITAAFTNLDPRPICHVAFDVVTLTGAAPPVVLTSAGLPIGGQGAAVTAAAASAPADLAAQAGQSYQFRIGLPQREGIAFLVNVLGEATSGACTP